MKWYKHDPDAFLAGTMDLTPEERGVYIVVISLLYSRNGDLPTDDRFFARYCGCDPRTWRRIRDRLLAKGKIHYRIDGNLTANRVEVELKSARRRIEAMTKLAEKRWKNKDYTHATPHMTTTTTTIKKEKEEERERPLTRPTRKRVLSLKVPIPDEWFPEGQLTPAECRELEKMKDWAKSNAIRKADWEATWRNWKRRAPEFIGNGTRSTSAAPRPGSREDSLEKTRRAYAKFCEHAAAGADDKGAGNAAGQASLRLISNDKFT
jgi:uncharacterized protein YdaU (DUF1376 family)